MIKLEKNIINLLHSNRQISFRYDLLNYNETKWELTLRWQIRVKLLPNKRKGSFQFKENELKDVDWLNDKVQPVLF